jgi:hypothetical protein
MLMMKMMMNIENDLKGMEDFNWIRILSNCEF